MRRVLAIGAMAFMILTTTAAAGAAAGTGSITGTVTGDGAPLSGICVDVHHAGDSLSRTQVTTNGSGTFSITVEAGTYVLRFSDCVRGNWAQEYYSDRTTFDAATPVGVTAGKATTLAAVSLAPASRISGRVTNGSSGLARMCVTAQQSDHPEVRGTAVTGPDGTFTVGGLPVGLYKLYGTDCANSPATRATAWYSGSSTPARGAGDARTVLGVGASTLAADLVLPKAASVTGVVVGDRGKDGSAEALAGICVNALDTGSNTTTGAVTDGTGRFRIGGLLPGDWLLRIEDCGTSPTARFATVFALASGVSADAAAAEAAPWSLASGDKGIGTRTLVLGGAIAGTVTGAADPSALRTPSAAGDPVVGACIGVTVPGSNRVLATATTAGNGTYTLGGLLPGQAYRVVAFNCGNRTAFGLEWHGDVPTAGTADTVSPAAGRVQSGVDFAVGDLVRRVAGADRRDTANQLARAVFDRADTVVLARADNYADALAGGPLAAQLDAPILLLPPTGLTQDVAATITELGASEAVILGGTAALTGDLEAQLDASTPIRTTRRVAGATRYDTARKVAAELPVKDRAYVVEGNNADPNRGWPDAVSVAGLAAQEGVPLVLVTRDAVPPESAAVLDGRAHVDVVGGPAAVSDAVLGQVDGLVGTVTRLSGADRYATSVAVVREALARGAWTRTVWLATGLNFPDSLVAGAVLAQDGGLLVLVHGQDSGRSGVAEAELIRLADGIDRVTLLGGTAAVSATTEARVRTIIGS